MSSVTVITTHDPETEIDKNTSHFDTNLTLVGNGSGGTERRTSDYDLDNNYFGDGDIHEDENAYIYYCLWTFVTPCLFAIIMLVGVSGNMLVIYVIVSRREMRSIANLMLVNLAVADVAFLIICVPLWAVKYAAETWTFGDTVCKIVQYFTFVSAYVTIYTLVAISALRYATVVGTSTTAKYRTKRNAIIIVIAIWICTSTANIPIYHAHTVKTIPGFSYCGIENTAIWPIHLSFFITGYAFPMFIITILYALILWHLAVHKPASVRQSRTRDRNTRTLRVIIVVILVFGISWLPTHVQSIVSHYVQAPAGVIYEIFRILWLCMAFGNSCINPIIYHFGSQEFRRSFRDVCCGGSRRCCYRRRKTRESSAPADEDGEEVSGGSYRETVGGGGGAKRGWGFRMRTRQDSAAALGRESFAITETRCVVLEISPTRTTTTKSEPIACNI